MAVRPVVLASSSPRRRELLTHAGLEVIVRPADCAELWSEGDAAAAAVGVARQKLRAAWRQVPPGDALLELPWLAADTAVLFGGEVLGKPQSQAHAAAMLERLAGSTHEVVTGVVLRFLGVEQAQAITTRVTFRALSAEDIARYVQSGEGSDKAGGYAIQGAGASLVDSVEGSLTNVIGLPLAQVLGSLEALSEALLAAL